MDFKNFKPCFLIAMPQLEDPNFQKTVILLTDYHKEGASGFVINRPSEMILEDTIVLSEGNLNPDYNDIVLYYGGPVDQEKIWILYEEQAHSNSEDTPLGDGVMIAQDIDILINAEKSLKPDQFHIYHGYAGWGEGQLDGELAVSAWITAPLSQDLLFHTPEDKVWEKAIKDLGFDPNNLVSPNSPFLN